MIGRKPPPAPFRFQAKHRLLAFAALIIWLIYALSPYGKLTTPAGHEEMTPLLHPGDSVYLYRHSENRHYQVGDIVWYRPNDQSPFRWGEIMAKTGDRLSIDEGTALKNGEPLPIRGFPHSLNRSEITVPEESFFIAHHQQEAPFEDSFTLGPLDIKSIHIEGKLFFHPSPQEHVKIDP